MNFFFFKVDCMAIISHAEAICRENVETFPQLLQIGKGHYKIYEDGHIFHKTFVIIIS